MKTEQLHRAEEEYLTLLQLPCGRLRSSMQRKLCELRDYIAEHTMRSMEEVQNEFTERAFVRAAGESLKKQLDAAEKLNEKLKLMAEMEIPVRMWGQSPAS